MVTMMTEQSRRLVGVAEIAERLGVPRSTVSMWDARRKTNGFPKPIERLSMGPVYDLDEIETWYAGKEAEV